MFAAKKKYFKPKILPFKSLKAIITAQISIWKSEKISRQIRWKNQLWNQLRNYDSWVVKVGLFLQKEEYKDLCVVKMSGLRSARDPNLSLDERLKILYPMVNEEETPLPRCWSFKDKFNYIGLSQVSLSIFVHF